MRYFYHPESSSLWSEEDDEPQHETDGLVVELTEEEYNAKVAELGSGGSHQSA